MPRLGCSDTEYELLKYYRHEHLLFKIRIDEINIRIRAYVERGETPPQDLIESRYLLLEVVDVYNTFQKIYEEKCFGKD